MLCSLSGVIERVLLPPTDVYRHDCFQVKTAVGSAMLFIITFGPCWFVGNVQIQSCLEYGHLLYFGAARNHLEHLDTLQCRAVGICHCTFPSLESRRHATAIDLMCRLLDGEGCGGLFVVVYSLFFLSLLRMVLHC